MSSARKTAIAVVALVWCVSSFGSVVPERQRFAVNACDGEVVEP